MGLDFRFFFCTWRHYFECGCCRFFFCSGVKFGPASELYCSPPNTRGFFFFQYLSIGVTCTLCLGSTNRLRGAPATPLDSRMLQRQGIPHWSPAVLFAQSIEAPRSAKYKCLRRNVHMVFQGGQSLSRQSLTRYCAL